MRRIAPDDDVADDRVAPRPARADEAVEIDALDRGVLRSGLPEILLEPGRCGPRAEAARRRRTSTGEAAEWIEGGWRIRDRLDEHDDAPRRVQRRETRRRGVGDQLLEAVRPEPHDTTVGQPELVRA